VTFVLFEIFQDAQRMRRVFNRTRVTRVQLSRTLSVSLCSFLVSIARASLCRSARARVGERECQDFFFFEFFPPHQSTKGKCLGFQYEFLFRGLHVEVVLLHKTKREREHCVRSFSLSLSLSRSERFSLFFSRPRSMRRRRSFLRPSVSRFLHALYTCNIGDSSILETR